MAKKSKDTQEAPKEANITLPQDLKPDPEGRMPLEVLEIKENHISGAGKPGTYTKTQLPSGNIRETR